MMDNRTLYIHDNLEILRGMNSESIDLIATDSPFNKGRDFHATPDSLAACWSSLYELIDLVRTQKRDDLAAFLCWLGVRVIEMRRALKPTGSLYLHCDPTASHYIKALLDGVFERRNFRNEIVWTYDNRLQRSSKRLSRLHDIILVYAKDNAQAVNNPVYSETWEPPATQRRRLQTGWEVRKGVLIIYDESKIGDLDLRDYEKVTYSRAGQPPLGDVWDTPILNPASKERIGYPTQKPVALYKRIIEASSNEGDIVLDPFCGCATTLVAAENLKRQWIGINLWEHAATALQGRIESPVHARRPPLRTDDEADVGAHLPSINRRQRRAEPWMRLSHADMRDILYAAQGGICAGFGRELHIRFMQLDHMQPRAEGGANTIDNRVMLCSPCNGAKGAVLTILGLVRANKRDGWLESDARRKRAYDRAILYGNAAREKDSAALIGLIRGLPIEGERKAAIKRLLAPPQTELALGL